MRTFLLIGLLLSNSLFACYNESRPLLNGQTKVFEEESLVPLGQDIDQKFLLEQRTKLIEDWQANKEIADYLDYGLTFAYLGEYKKALEIFLEAEKLEPNRYETAANIGTTYELMGQNDSAFKWIDRALKLNPNAHFSSEWLHLKILKIKQNKNLKIENKNLINVDFGNEVIPKSDLKFIELEQLQKAIYYQLSERMTFVKPKDPFVALLLFELGNITAITSDLTTALRNYDKAIEYGFNSEILSKRYKYFQDQHIDLQGEYENEFETKTFFVFTKLEFFVVCLLIALVIGIALIFNKQQKRKQQKAGIQKDS